MSEHSHHHGNLGGSTVNTELHQPFLTIGKEERIDNLIHRLVQNAYQAKNQYRKRIDKHPLQQCLVHPIGKATKLGNQAKKLQTGCYQIGDKDVPYQIGRIIEPIHRCGKMHMQPRAKQQEEQVQNDIGNDGNELNGNKFNGTLFITQISERDAQERIERHDHYHHPDEVRMIAIVQKIRDRLKECQTKDGKDK